MKHFRIKLIVLFIFLLSCLVALASIFGRVDYFFTQLVLISIIAITTWQCFYLIDTTNREIKKFLFALNYLDSSISFPNQTKNSFQQLHNGLNKAIQEIAVKTEQNNFQKEGMEHVIRRMPIGVMLLHENGDLLFCNEMVLEFLSIPALKKIDQM